MERPFDYPGMSEPTGFEPHQMTPSIGPAMHHRYEGATYVIGMWFAPEWWTDDEVSRAVSYLMEPEHCQHAHDCCGRYYSGGGRVLAIRDGHVDEHGQRCRLVIVGTTFTQNI